MLFRSNDTATTEIYTPSNTLSLHDALPVSPFSRALQTANIALAGRDVPHVVDEELGDVRIGELEGKSLDAYRAAPAHSNREERFPGGESLDEAALRYAAAGSGELNGPLRYAANATPYLFGETSLRRGVERMRELSG